MPSDPTLTKKVVIELPYRIEGVGRFLEYIANTIFFPFSKRVYHQQENRSVPYLRVYDPHDSQSIKNLKEALGDDSVRVVLSSDPKFGLDCLYYDVDRGGAVLTDAYGGEIKTWTNLSSIDDIITRTRSEQRR